MKRIIKEETGGFTLIELLVVISIIGLLSTVIMTSISGTRFKARSVSFQTTVKSIQAAQVMCCEGVGTSLVPASGSPTAGNATCFNSATHVAIAGYPNYPGDKSVGTINVTSDCNNGSFAVEIQPGTDTTGGWAKATCDSDKCDFSNT